MQTNQDSQQENKQESQEQGALERSIDVVVSVADVARETDARLKQIAKSVKMPGFRPGKVPLKMIAQTHGAQAHSEALGAAVQSVLSEKLREQNLRIAGQPRLEPKEGAGEGEFSFVAKFEVFPEIVLGDVSAITIERPVLQVGDAEVDKTIEVLRKQRMQFEDAGRAAQEGDRVVIDFVGKRDGEPFDGGTAKDFPFVIGAGQMLAGFESAVHGLQVGESKTFDLTFPEDYHAPALAGVAVSFDVTMKQVQGPKLPELNEEFARSLGVADGDLLKMRDEVRLNLEREVKRRVQARIKEQAMDALITAHPIEVPKALIESESRQLAENAKRDLEMRGMRTQDLPVQADWFTEQAVRRVKLGLIMAELVRNKDLYAQPEQIRATIEEFAQSYEDPQEVIRWHYSQSDRMAQVEALAVEDNVVEWVLNNARAEDKAVEFDEFMGKQD